MSRRSSTLLLLLSIIVILFNVSNVACFPAIPEPVAFSCFDHEDPLSDAKLYLKPVDCLMVREPKEINKRQAPAGMTFNLTCNSTKPDFCNKVNTNLEFAANIITSVLQFKQTVVVQISFNPLGSLLGR